MPDSRISMPSVRRFPSYLRILMQNREAGHKTISATQLAEELGLTPIQVRKDLASTGIEGRPKVGFSIEELISSITHALGWDNLTEALIVGAGNLGSALAAYDGFSAYGLRIVAIFDKDPSKIGKRIGDLTVLPVDGINQYIMVCISAMQGISNVFTRKRRRTGKKRSLPLTVFIRTAVS